MAFRVSDAGEQPDVAHEINVTPFIDVMLVLLIIFMVAAPLATIDVPVDLPKSSLTSPPPESVPVYLTLDRDLTVSVNDHTVGRAGFTSALAEATRGNKGTRIFLRADATVAYGRLMDLMDQVSAAGYDKVALVALKKA